MAWQTPKTNWKSTDYFNYQDYERIRNNILHLKNLVDQVYATITLDAMTAKSGYSDFVYADEFNAFENNLDKIKKWITTVGIGSKQTFYDNGATPNYTELNRIESACLKMYKTLSGQISGRPMLSFILNGGTIQI